MQISDKILEATDGGKAIILELFPEAEKSMQRKGNFRIRPDDKDPSASAKRTENGHWIVKDFATGEVFNGVSLYAYHYNIEFSEACSRLASKYQIDGAKAKIEIKFTKRKAKKTEKEGYSFDFRDELTDFDLRAIGKHFDNETATKYKLKSVKSYSIVKNGEFKKWESTPDQPILCFDFGTWQKLLQPKSQDKKYRFRYFGEKPNDFVFGLEQVKKKFQKHQSEMLEEYEDLAMVPEGKVHLDSVLIASGDRDALNLLSLGFDVVWLNSESARIDDLYYKLKDMTTKVVNVPDIDEPGIKQAHKRGKQFISLYNAYLDSWLLEKKDWRGNSKKDVTDYIEHLSNSLGLSKENTKRRMEKVVNDGIRLQFWNEKFTKRGAFSGYELDVESYFKFLEAHDFWRYDRNGEIIYVKIEGHIVHEVTVNDIIDFVVGYLRDKRFPQKLRNFILTNTYVSNEGFYRKMNMKRIDFQDSWHNTQILHFNNVTWMINQKGVQEIKPKDCKYFVWADKVIPHNVQRKESELQIRNFGEDTEFDLPLKPQCVWTDYLKKTSNMYWQKSKEIEGLDEGEQREVLLHFANKIYATGYLLHGFKSRAKSWMVLLMENEIITTGGSEGRTGKSAFAFMFSALKKLWDVDCSHHDNVDDWMFGGVNEQTDIVLLDDLYKYFPLRKLFVNITGNMDVNIKGGAKTKMDFEKSPKFIATTNFAPKDNDSSTNERLLNVLVSDYFHGENEEKGLKRWTIQDEYGIQIPSGFNENQWNLMFNTMADCLVYYFRSPIKIDPPMANAKKRQLISEMGETFKDWADTYFSEEAGRIDKAIERDEAFGDFRTVTNTKNWTTQAFSRSLKAWCKFYGFELNPSKIKGKLVPYFSNHHKCIMMRVDYGNKNVKPHIYIHTLTETENEE
jgi:hypothetical protein